MNFHGQLPGYEASRPARVTIYRGVAVHVESGDLNLDTLGAPVDRTDDFRLIGLIFLIGGPFLAGAVALLRSARGAVTR